MIRKKILFYIDSFMLGGEQKIAIDYLMLLHKDYELTLLVNQNLGDENFFLDSIPDGLPIHFVVEEATMKKLEYYKKRRKNNIWNRLMYSYYLSQKRKERLKKISAILEKISYDICIDFSNKLPIDTIDESVIIWNHTSLAGLSQKELEQRRQRYSKASKVVVISENMKREFLEAFPSISSKIFLVPNFVDVNHIQTLAKEDIPEKEEFFLCCSRLDKKKDIATSIRAFHLWKKDSNHQEKLFILGEGEDRRSLENLVGDLSLEKEVVFLGRKENPYSYMKRAKLFLHSSLQEGFGLVLVEAMACGTPVIATDCPVGPKEILKNGEAGCLVALKNFEEMYEQMFNLLQNKEEYLKFQKFAKERAKDFDREMIMEKMNLLLSDF